MKEPVTLDCVLFLCEKMKDYKEFLIGKSHLSGNYGFEPVYMPDYLFDFQKYVSEYAIKKGRCAIYLDTGLGKTPIQLTIAENIVIKTNKPALILTPLAVAYQFIDEAKKMGISDVEHSKDGKYKEKIVVTNYERLHYFNPDDFGCVLLDESSILKNFNGAIKNHVTSFMKKIKYRFLSTATPSPNDFIELGTSSEALGYMGYMEMLQKYFANNENNIRPQEIGTKWYIKPHAVDAFFEWVGSWSISARKPSDLGFSDEKFILPDLHINDHYVKNDKNWIVNGQIMMFGQIAKTMTEVRQEQKMTFDNRCNRAVELSSHHDVSVYWCNFNDEGDLLEKLDKDAKQIKGSMDIDKKEEMLVSFSKGEIKKLITKPKITAFGLNWQHCNHTVYFPDWSYEKWYQAIRRFWRFGQQREVTAERVLSDGQKRVIDAITYKTDKANKLYTRLNNNLNNNIELKKERFTKKLNLPKFI